MFTMMKGEGAGGQKNFLQPIQLINFIHSNSQNIFQCSMFEFCISNFFSPKTKLHFDKKCILGR